MAETQALHSEMELELCSAYKPDPDVYDEMCSAPGMLRPHWRALVQTLENIGREELGRCHEQVQRLLQENGVTYNVYDDARNAQRPWVVDPIPMLLDSTEWAAIEAGLTQRARLLDRLLADLYGARTVVRQGLLPPELVYTYPDFLRPCHEALLEEQRWLIFHGVDLVRFPDGDFRVVADRSQAPAGVGYALENRVLMARAWPDLYRDAPLRRLAGFLSSVRATLAQLALHNHEQPHIVVLTPGPGSRTYFEHAYLANYLSFTLVEGEDLTVREGRVWLKTLGGLKAVDVILRRIEDSYCDPLELRGDSLLGVPGLLQAVRGGGVAVANALGSGVVENPALAPFLAGLCRHLLGEDLLLRSIETWWCGEAEALDYVLANLDKLVIRSVLPHSELQSGALLEPEEKTALIERLQASPELFVAHEPIVMSTAPMLDKGYLVPRPMVLRGFIVADEEGYRVMPGGLARVSANAGDSQVSVHKGGISKDLWVLAPTQERHISLLRQGEGPVAVTRDGSDLPSRVADNLYWLGRYGERLDGTSRLLRETLIRLLEQEQGGAEDSCMDDLLRVLTLPIPPADWHPRPRFLAIRRELMAQISDEQRPSSLPAVLEGMLRTGRAVRNHLGDDSWRVLNRLQKVINRPPVLFNTAAARELLEDSLTLLAAFHGLINETMPHHHGWLFLDIGRHLERVLDTLDLLKLVFVKARRPGIPLWEVVLTSTDNLTAYRRRYRSELHPTAIIDLLLFDKDNPRAVGYQLRRLQTQIDRLPHEQITPYRSAEERLILKAVSILELADIDSLAALDRSAQAGMELSRLLDGIYESLATLSDALAHSHFSHAEVPRQLVRMQ